MANGFRLSNRRITSGQILQQDLGGASTQFVKGDALKLVEGILVKVTAADKCHGILNAMITPTNVMRPATDLLTTTAGEQLQFVPAAGGIFVFVTDLTGGDAPPINGTAVNSGSTTTALVTAAGNTGDYDGGTIYFPLTNTQHKITDDTVGAGVHTFTFVPPAPRAIGAGDTAIVVPFGVGMAAVKFSASSAAQGISPAVADKTGGHVKIEKVDLAKAKVYVSFPDLE